MTATIQSTAKSSNKTDRRNNGGARPNPQRQPSENKKQKKKSKRVFWNQPLATCADPSVVVACKQNVHAHRTFAMVTVTLNSSPTHVKSFPAADGKSNHDVEPGLELDLGSASAVVKFPRFLGWYVYALDVYGDTAVVGLLHSSVTKRCLRGRSISLNKLARAV